VSENVPAKGVEVATRSEREDDLAEHLTVAILSKPALASARAKVESITGVIALLTIKFATRSSSARFPIIDPTTRNCVKKILVSSALAGSSPDVATGLGDHSDLDRVEALSIFGSWAARDHREAGPPGDVDVLVVGTPDRDDVYDATNREQMRIGPEVYPALVSPRRWQEAAEPFSQGVRRRPTPVPGAVRAGRDQMSRDKG
jgi:hypothetical protein